MDPITVVGLASSVAAVLVGVLAWLKPRSPDKAKSRRARGVQSEANSIAERYLRAVDGQVRYLDFRGVLRLDRLDMRFPLEEVCVVPRLVRLSSVSSAESGSAGRTVNFTDVERILTAVMEGRQDRAEARDLVDLLTAGRCSVLLGEPGSGKSTLLKLLALRLTRSQGARLPILVPLTALSSRIVEGGGEHSVLDAVSRYLAEVRHVDPGFDVVMRERYEAGELVFLFDGLDELADPSARAVMTNRLQSFAQWTLTRGNTLVVTSRVVGYSDMPLGVPDGEHLLVKDFDAEGIQEFVDKWTFVAERVANDTRSDVELAHASAAASISLKQAVFSNPGVRRLASNPLLLSILVFIHRQGAELPRRRAELYDLFITTIVTSWSRVRNLDGQALHTFDTAEVMKILSPVAYWIHSDVPEGYVRVDAMEDAVAAEYETQRGLSQDEATQRAKALLSGLLHSSGLLAERGEGRIGFAHLTFEEFMTARQVVLLGQVDKGVIGDLLAPRRGDPRWVEVLALVIGFLANVSKEEASADLVVRALAQAGPDFPDSKEALLVAAEAATECGEDGLPVPTWDWLRDEMSKARDWQSVALRCKAGALLSEFGDPKFDPAVIEPETIYVPGGDAVRGSEPESINRRMAEIRRVRLSAADEWVRGYWETCLTSELDVERASVKPFRIGRYPVLQQQYAHFVRETGRRPPNGSSLRAVLLSWDPRTSAPPSGRRNQPVVLVSWQDAVAYCEWLSAKTSKSFRLPTELEWEYCARGSSGSGYPWGDIWEPGRANTAEEAPGDLVACGLFPKGASWCGAEELVGQVWEWTADSWGDDWSRPSRHPGEVAPWKVVKGGSWDDVRVFANSTSRGANLETFASDYIGFRILEEI
ncbi:SUMF1/EgtB/PvdO family nonheme iron enzyme [Ornithinimicrobium sp. LYQ121]|uniref:SUMF1/EgtB/PvdO family nonheme iron enzyme n=1 Tax=Ornithinimicrobium sp. LYQ121 TaxID=3378801 RepID=UPI003854D5E5